MISANTAQPTLLSTVLPTTRNNLLHKALLALAGTALLTVSAKINIPMWPVPMTMQTFAVLVIGMAFGPILGAATVALYLLEGAFGLPVFAGTPAKGIGLAYMAGPTGGYLLGFVLSAFTVGMLSRLGWDRNVGLTLLAMAIGTAMIFFFGVTWLSALIGFEKAIQFGLTPFLAGAALKIALAAALLPFIWKVLRKNA